MTTTNPNQAEQAIAEHLSRLDWMIQDAKRQLANAAKEMLRRAESAVKETDAMLADEPCSLMWTEFADGDVRTAKEAKVRLTQLLEQQTMLRFFLKTK